MQRKMAELEDQIETHEARRRSDTIVGRLQGKVERVQEVSLSYSFLRVQGPVI